MITMKELLGPNKLEEQSEEVQSNLKELLNRVNVVRLAYNKPMRVTSGLRSIEDHLRIYKAKGIDIADVPMKSKHLIGAAIDIADPGLVITKWLKSPEGSKYLEQADLYCEEGNSNWVHFQCIPFGSYKAGGTRWFNP